jgi:hypothetical protein
MAAGVLMLLLLLVEGGDGGHRLAGLTTLPIRWLHCSHRRDGRRHVVGVDGLQTIHTPQECLCTVLSYNDYSQYILPRNVYVQFSLYGSILAFFYRKRPPQQNGDMRKRDGRENCMYVECS